LIDRFRVLTHVLRQEAAFSLGVAGRRLGAAVEALQRFDTSGKPRVLPERVRLLRNAAHALSACVIQREALGIRDHAALSTEYAVTSEIWHAMGISEESAASPQGTEGSQQPR